ncbi:MAG: hypothetical protein EOP04_33160 [Proteobacteria bacterium]|nr:MAG: hypothetical protein EOP04_33160 [Pseudomonadota bacterium]
MKLLIIALLLVSITSISAQGGYIKLSDSTISQSQLIQDLRQLGIEYLLDRDHQIGHAYLIGCDSKADVDERMRNRIIPLLQEYFYEDLAKVCRLLGEGFIETTKLAPFGRGDDEGEQERIRYRVRASFDQEAYDKLTA